MHGRMLVGLAAANLGLLFVADENLRHVVSMVRGGSTMTLSPFAPVLAAVVGLLGWQLAPRRAWSWLLLAGALRAVPEAVQLLGAGTVSPRIGVAQWVEAGAPVFTLIGVLGAATLAWRAGRRGVAAALMGTAATFLLLPAVTLRTYARWSTTDIRPALTAVLTGLGLLAAVVAVFTRKPPDCRPRPGG
jgi:hypothetical protein